MPTIRPITRPARSMGPDTMSVVNRASRPTSITIAVVTQHLRLRETGHNLLDNKVPAIDQYKKNQLEWQGNQDGRQHHHAHGHEKRGYHHINDKERYIQQKTDNKSLFEFADNERGNNDRVGQIVNSARDLHF